MPRLKSVIILLLVSFTVIHSQSNIGIGSIQTNVPWKAGHASGKKELLINLLFSYLFW